LHIPLGLSVSRVTSESGLYVSYGSNSDSISSILSCKQWAVGSNGSVEVQYTKGGSPVILVPDDILHGSGLCNAAGEVTTSNISDGCRWRVNVPLAVTFLSFLGILLSFII
jgi:alpha-amylase